MAISLSALSNCVGGHVSSDVVIQGLSLDSRAVGPEVGFVAVPGEHTDGRKYIDQAVKLGAPCIIYEAHNHEANLPREKLERMRLAHPNVIFMPVTGLTDRMGRLAQAMYPVSAESFKLAAVTGTNGKTTTSGWIAGACHAKHPPAGWSGTLGIGHYSDLNPSRNTTPDIFTLWQWMHEIHRQRGIYGAMEASSHALAQRRFHGLPIHTAVWTHLSQDHLDYHGTMEAYAAEKRKLLRWPTLKYCVLNLGDATAREAFETGDYSGQPLTYQVFAPQARAVPEINSVGAAKKSHSARGERQADYVVSALQCAPDGLHMTLSTPEGQLPWHLPCWGYYNAENAMAALLTLISFGWPLTEACQTLAKVPLPAGRLEPVAAPGFATVIVDYAHTPDALKQVLRAVRPHCKGQLWVVFGCGGDRDTGKRPLMGAAAQALADKVVLTDDNPRSEASEHILHQIQSGMTGADVSRNCWVKSDRAEAIAFAVRKAAIDDVVVVAGKGHEDYQEINGERISFSDREVVKQVFACETT